MTHYRWHSEIAWLEQFYPMEAKFIVLYEVDPDKIQEVHQDEMEDTGFFVDLDDPLVVLYEFDKVDNGITFLEEEINELLDKIANIVWPQIEKRLKVIDSRIVDAGYYTYESFREDIANLWWGDPHLNGEKVYDDVAAQIAEGIDFFDEPDEPLDSDDEEE